MDGFYPQRRRRPPQAQEKVLGESQGVSKRLRAAASPSREVPDGEDEDANFVQDRPVVVVDSEEDVGGADDDDDLRFMIVDVVVENGGRTPLILLYGLKADGHSVCCHVTDFRPYFWFPAPVLGSNGSSRACNQDDLRGLKAELCKGLQRRNPTLTGEAVAGISLHQKQPIMYYRPDGASSFVKVELYRHEEVNGAVREMLELAGTNALKATDGLSWPFTPQAYEEDIGIAQRFLCDAKLAGGAWLRIPSQSVEPVANNARLSRCKMEVSANWQAIVPLTPDATWQLEGPLPTPPAAQQASSKDGSKGGSRSDARAPGSKEWLTVPPLKILTLHVEAISKSGMTPSSQVDPVAMITCRLSRKGSSVQEQERPQITTFTTSIQRSPPGVTVRMFDGEAVMLSVWQKWLADEIDPDVICVFDIKHSLRYLSDRYKAARLGVLDLGRRLNQDLKVKSVVSYNKNWVRSQSRMSSTSNQEVFRADVEGRLVLDVLRPVLVGHTLSAFTLPECSAVFLKKPLEVLNSQALCALWNGQVQGPPDGMSGPERIANYGLKRVETVFALLEHLQVIAETLEMARVTGITLPEVQYKAQMHRVFSLLLRAASRDGLIIGQDRVEGTLSESPFLLHPIKNNNAGLHEDPVAILDFASLYPSLYMAHNLCYTTLVHAADAPNLTAENVFTTPTGAKFVKNNVIKGVLPRICKALISARAEAQRAVLDGRQKALKLCANALYGYTGAGASRLQAVPIADSCLALGSQSCQKAMAVVEATLPSAKVIYCQTDSVFVRFAGASVQDAIRLGHEAAKAATAQFPQPISLKFERVMHPFLLLQVNRYAGVGYTSESDTKGNLVVKGLESERRDVPPLLRTTAAEVLKRILVERDVEGALAAAQRSISLLLSGSVSLFDVLMTEGLWRVDGDDIKRAAGLLPAAPRSDTTVASIEELRGPHAALAVRLQKRDPSRAFHIGERIPYALLSGRGTKQDDMAEDPMRALEEGSWPNYYVYWENKMRRPLENLFEHVLSKAQTKELFAGTHTRQRPTQNPNFQLEEEERKEGTGSARKGQLSGYFKPKPTCVCCRQPLASHKGPGPAPVLCSNCREGDAVQRLTLQQLSLQQQHEVELSVALSQCARCHSGGLMGTVLCTNWVCPALYMRTEGSRHARAHAATLDQLGRADCI
eukprot:jgi/Chlat1/5669/Chrsp37S00424